jgi:hypothetical protein
MINLEAYSVPTCCAQWQWIVQQQVEKHLCREVLAWLSLLAQCLCGFLVLPRAGEVKAQDQWFNIFPRFPLGETNRVVLTPYACVPKSRKKKHSSTRNQVDLFDKPMKAMSVHGKRTEEREAKPRVEG